MRGIVQHLRIEQEGKDLVLRFVLQSEEESHVAVEMRGMEIRGVLNDDDHVSLVLPSASTVSDNVARPIQIHNLKTRSVIYMWRPSRFQRVLSYVGSIVGPAIIATVATTTVSALFTTEESGSGIAPEDGFATGDGSEAASLIVAVVVEVTVLWLLWLVLFRKTRRRRSKSLWSPLVGLALGVLLANGILAWL